jgi:3',5'-nucleoside bisphosphate phosphatase
MKYADLHVHTLYSDGDLLPQQIIKIAKDKELEMLSITDHDSLKGYFKALPYADEHGITLVPGVEISTIQYHLLGLNFDPQNERFNNFVKRSQDIQKGVCNQRIDVLRSHGVPISLEIVENEFPESSIGTYNLLISMIKDPNCSAYMNKQHGTLDIRTLYGIYFSTKKGIAHSIEKIQWIELEDAINEIHLAGGNAIFAHPPKYATHPSEVIEMLKKVDGIEVQPKFGEKNNPFKDYAHREGKIITYGSDFHRFEKDDSMLSRNDPQIDEAIFGTIKR